ncbi:MAG: DUF1801 domain-containing protein [Rhizobiaceae bacterium]
MSADSDIASYLLAQPPDRRATMEALRALVETHLPRGYVEAFRWGMVTFEVPLATSGPTYNGQPLMIVAIGNQKNHVGLYLSGVYCVPRAREKLEAAFRKAGKKLDMGKSCLRLKTLDDVDLPAIEEAVAAVTPAMLVAASDAAPRKKR